MLVPVICKLLTLLLFLLRARPGVAHPLLLSENQWSSVHRSLFTADTVYLASCPQSCSSLTSSSRATHSTHADCFCQCAEATPVFMPSVRSCVSKLEECKKPIPFRVDDRNSQWIPTLSLPSTNNIIAPSNAVLWKESSIEVGAVGDVNCSLGEALVQSDDLWLRKDHSKLFALKVYANSTYIMWKGNEVDARILEGTLVHLKLTCAEDAKTTFCLVFRIAGIHVNSKWTSGSGEELQWRHVELIACILLAILLAITVFASISLWAVCWPIKKGKLISRMQLHFLYHIKQQQQYMQEQIAAVKVSCSQHPTSALDGQHFSPCAAIQKRKLYFSADFFEPEMLANPPQMAQQFVVELRKMIEIAKDRARLKRHIPTLATITEEHENAEYLEISSPSCGAVQRVDEPSPKSVKSSDSGCDSMSDDDTQTQSTSEQSENCVCASADRLSTSRTPIMAPTAKNSCPNAAAAVIPSRISTMASSRMVSPMTPSPRLPPKSAVFNGIRMSNGLASGAIVPTSCAPPNEPPPPPPALRNPPSLERVLNSVPPPPPDSEPPDPSSMQAFQVNCPTRTAYAVFPNESMRKKSLPRRSKKASQKGVPPPPVETSM